MSVKITDYPAAAEGRPVTEAHARVCAERGHATWTRDGQASGVCPRCGDERAALATPLTPDYVGTMRHECPNCRRPGAIREDVCRADDGTITSHVYYCQWVGCDWQIDTVVFPR